MGVSNTRSPPKRSSKPEVAPYVPPKAATSSPNTTTVGSRSISSAMAWAMALEIVKTAIVSFGVAYGSM